MPARTPPAITAALNRVITDGVNSPQFKERLAAEGSEPPERMTPAELKAALQREYVEVERTVKELNLPR